MHTLVDGEASGDLVCSDVALSFWGGVDLKTGTVIDKHHPLHGQNLSGRIVAIPSGRGSCTGSGAILELLHNKCAPAALIFREPELILTLGVLVAWELFGLSIPVISVTPVEFQSLEGQLQAQTIITSNDVRCGSTRVFSKVVCEDKASSTSVKLTRSDQDVLDGSHGLAAQTAMKVLVQMADLQGAPDLLDITQAHIDACIYIGESALQFAERLLFMGGTFKVPTTLNSISIDRRRWQELGVPEDKGTPASRLAEVYMAMGAKMSFTCAPYLLESSPRHGEQIGWAESNAVVFANSVLGARTQKYPDFQDVCIALTGRAPRAGCHLDEGRLPRLRIVAPPLIDYDDSLYPLLGYCVGKLSGAHVPLVCGLEQHQPKIADLKAFSAAFATMSSSSMFHINGVTPESKSWSTITLGIEKLEIFREDLMTCWQDLNTATDQSVGLVALGNPHFSLEEFQILADYCLGGAKHAGVAAIITTSRHLYTQAAERGYVDILVRFGFDFITDTCWCMIEEPVIPLDGQNIMTNSAKYAHYAPGMVNRGVHFGSLAECAEAARSAKFERPLPLWLKE